MNNFRTHVGKRTYKVGLKSIAQTKKNKKERPHMNLIRAFKKRKIVLKMRMQMG